MVSIERFVGAASDFHARPVPDCDDVLVWWFRNDRPALVLGSGQADDTVDHDECGRRGIEVVRRRSGGGAVYLAEGRTLWLDVVLPRDHRLWTDDVSMAAVWLGDLWVRALEECGLDGLTVHRGAMRRTEFSDTVCFDGRGPGEVFRGEAKVVGISQRRTRRSARFQCAVSLDWRPHEFVGLLGLPADVARRLSGSATTLSIDGARIDEVMTRSIEESLGRG